MVLGLPCGSDGKESAYGKEKKKKNLLTVGGTQVQSLGWSVPWRREPTPVFLPGKSMDREAWQTIVHAVAESGTTELLTLALGFVVYVGHIQVTCRELENEVFNLYVEANFFIKYIIDADSKPWIFSNILKVKTSSNILTSYVSNI